MMAGKRHIVCAPSAGLLCTTGSVQGALTYAVLCLQGGHHCKRPAPCALKRNATLLEQHIKRPVWQHILL